MSSSQSIYDKMSIEDTIKSLNTDTKIGLKSQEVASRLTTYGENSLENKKESIFKKLLAFFWGPIPWMIEIAAILSAILGNWSDLTVIILMLVINAALGFFQEFKAGNAIEALKEKLALHATVLRDGKWQDIEAKLLVPGDVIKVKLGNIIPADIKLISGDYLSIDQSSLTGESLPVSKKQSDIAYSGTAIKMGEMIGIVTLTGMNTFFGKTAKLISSATSISNFQKAVLKIGNFLIISTLVICTLILIVSLYRLEIEHITHETLGEIVIFILVLVVAGIPVALPAVLSATMAIGANKLAKLKAIVSKLTAIEELASMDILCSDKTGTLTQNKLTVGDIKLFDSKDPNEVITVASIASATEAPDPIDEAIYNKLQNKEALKQYTRVKFIPFDPVSKRSTTIIKNKEGQEETLVKGAPQVIVEQVNPSEELRKEIMQAVIDFAQKGYRTLGVAKKTSDNKWSFLGLISLFDPPREDTKETLDTIKQMGVDIKMVTGDHEAIAKELSEKLGLGTNIVPTNRIYKDNIPSRTRDQKLEDADGFAEVFPEHKFEIVQTLQRDGHVTGMTGDGVNDAPALKQANVGIAVSGATDAAKESADLVLTEPGLMVISHAIAEARRIFGRMKSYAMYRISETCRLLLFLSLSMIVFNDHPLSAIMIILIALLNDIPIMMIAYDHMRTHTKPVTWNMNEVLTISIGLAIVGVISTFGLYWMGDKYWFIDVLDPLEKFHHLRTLAFMAILCGGNLTIYLTRNIRSIWSKPYPEIKFFLSTLISQIIGTLVSVYGLGTEDFIGIGWKYVGLAWIYILVWFLICMLVKETLYRMIGYRKKISYMENFVKTTAHKIK
jgi:H+-transporting ATPase